MAMDKAEIGNKEVLARILGREFLASAFAGFGLTFVYSALPINQNIFANVQHFSTLLITATVGIAALAVTTAASGTFLNQPANQHLKDDWRFKTQLTKIAFLSFVIMVMAFSLPLTEVLSGESNCLSYLRDWATLSAIILTMVASWYAVGLIKRVVGYSVVHE